LGCNSAAIFLVKEETLFVKRLIITLIASLAFWACNKNVIPVYDLAKYLKQEPTVSRAIGGRWILIATRHNSAVFGGDTTWKTRDTVNSKVTITFGIDSLFTYNENYLWQAQQFDRWFQVVGIYTQNPVFSIYASNPPGGNIARPPTFATLQNTEALIVTYMGVDTNDQELYLRTLPLGP
jgi:hypothetical protein